MRRDVGGRSLGALRRDSIELGELVALGFRLDQTRAQIQVIDDFEDVVLQILGGRVARQDATDAQMFGSSFGFGDQRVRGLVHAVVQEGVARALAQE